MFREIALPLSTDSGKDNLTYKTLYTINGITYKTIGVQYCIKVKMQTLVKYAPTTLNLTGHRMEKVHLESISRSHVKLNREPNCFPFNRMCTLFLKLPHRNIDLSHLVQHMPDVFPTDRFDHYLGHAVLEYTFEDRNIELFSDVDLNGSAYMIGKVMGNPGTTWNLWGNKSHQIPHNESTFLRLRSLLPQ